MLSNRDRIEIYGVSGESPEMAFEATLLELDELRDRVKVLEETMLTMNKKLTLMTQLYGPTKTLYKPIEPAALSPEEEEQLRKLEEKEEEEEESEG